jgi:hypothetical protein
VQCWLSGVTIFTIAVKRLAAGYAQLFLERFPDAMGWGVELGAAFLNGKAIMAPARSAIFIGKCSDKENAPTEKLR